MNTEVVYACGGRVRLLRIRDEGREYIIDCDNELYFKSIKEAEEYEC